MSIASNFDRVPDAGFSRSFDVQSARRQFQLSVILVLILAAATFMLGAMIRFDAPVSASVNPIKPVETHYAVDRVIQLGG
jgi:hypothetical protein